MKIAMSLSQKSIQDAIDEIKKYQKKLQDKNETFVERLRELGYAVANYYTSTALGDDTDTVTVDSEIENGNLMCRARILLNGKDTADGQGNTAFFIEFGAGITYNPNNLGAENPLGQGKYGVGTYPNQEHAFNPKGWWYTDENGESKHSYGTEATMPLYHAITDIEQNVKRVAKEVFG